MEIRKVTRQQLLRIDQYLEMKCRKKFVIYTQNLSESNGSKITSLLEM